MKEISINDIGPVYIGQTENADAGTGCTVFLSKEGMPAGIDIRGAGPATRDTRLLDPMMSVQTVNGIVLSGGSAFGLSASGGVMKYLEERGIGLDVAVTKVPIVVQADIFDLPLGDVFTRPDETMGYEAAKNAFENPNYRDGNYGVGCGASCGKYAGMDRCMKTGIGSYAVQIGDLRIGAAVVVNALGDIFDWKNAKKIAGVLSDDKRSFADTTAEFTKSTEVIENRIATNTTLAIVMTNAAFDKTVLCKIAGMAHDGYARSIRPVHSSVDGDTIFAVSVGDIAADKDVAGELAAQVVSEAIIRAVTSAKGAYGIPAACDLDF